MPVVKNRQDNYVKMRDQGIDGNNLEPAQRSAVTGQSSRMGGTERQNGGDREAEWGGRPREAWLPPAGTLLLR